MKGSTHISLPSWQSDCADVFPTCGRKILEDAKAFIELCRLAEFQARRSGLDADDLAQDVALRILKRNPTVASAADWSGLCATVARNLCRDFWRRAYARSAEFRSLDEEVSEGFTPLEQEAALAVLADELHRAEMERAVARRGEALVRLAASSSRLPKGCRRILQALLQNRENPKLFKANGKLNGNALARLSGLNQCSISRAIQPIQEAAAEILPEPDVDF